MLSDVEILESKQNKEIIIFPFNEEQLGPNSYDVTIGEHYYVQNKEVPEYLTIGHKETYMKFWDLDSSEKYFGVKYAQESKDNSFEDLGIVAGDKIITIHPGDTILAHTNEFIGGMTKVTTEMKAKSTSGRSCVTVCACAGLGDIGYVNRWTMEIKNHGRSTVLIKTGTKLAQICFFKTGECNRPYYLRGQYQQTDNFEEIVSTWVPTMMLPSFVKK